MNKENCVKIQGNFANGVGKLVNMGEKAFGFLTIKPKLGDTVVFKPYAGILCNGFLFLEDKDIKAFSTIN